MKSIWFGSGFGFLAPTRRKHIFIHIYFILFSYCFHIFLYFSYCFRICFIFISYLFCSCFQPRHSSPTATPSPTQALSACPARPGRKSCFFPIQMRKHFQTIFSAIFCSYFFHIFSYYFHFFILFSYFSIFFPYFPYRGLFAYLKHKEATSRPPPPAPAPTPPPPRPTTFFTFFHIDSILFSYPIVKAILFSYLQIILKPYSFHIWIILT